MPFRFITILKLSNTARDQAAAASAIAAALEREAHLFARSSVAGLCKAEEDLTAQPPAPGATAGGLCAGRSCLQSIVEFKRSEASVSISAYAGKKAASGRELARLVDAGKTARTYELMQSKYLEARAKVNDRAEEAQSDDIQGARFAG
ncbi:MAG: hypothetical protein WC889_06840 [Myxococcota bacterium]|jgi:hypothetical protein